MLKDLMAMLIVAGLVTGNGPVGSLAAPVMDAAKSFVGVPRDAGRVVRDLVAGGGARTLVAYGRR